MITLRRARPGLGTIIDIAASAASLAAVRHALELAFGEIEAAEASFSAHRAGSEAMLLSSRAHREPMAVSAPMQALLATALELHRASAGIFDITVGGALAARGLLPRLCGDGDGDSHGALGSSADISIGGDGRVAFRRPLRLDFGGIAKGYAIDRAVAVLREHGATRGCVNAGGDMRVFGQQSAPVALRFGDGVRVVAQLHDGALAVSRAVSGAHLDARGGGAVMHGDSVAVFAPQAMIADALTKVALVCPQSADRLCPLYAAQWRGYPFDLAA